MIKICNGCGGVIGRDCFNPQECEQISFQQNSHDEYQRGYNDGLQAACSAPPLQEIPIREVFKSPLSTTAGRVFWRNHFEVNNYKIYVASTPVSDVKKQVEEKDLTLLTEENILKLRVVERDDFRPLLFSCQPPGERQMGNQYWSGWIHEDYKLHLNPSYKTVFPTKNTSKLSDEIEFWFIWYCEGSKFLPLMNIRQYKLKYVYQLRDVYFALTGKEITF